MATNIEIKARVSDLEATRSLAKALSDVPVELILQEDIFFHCPQGRLKLRLLGPDYGQLIYYRRQDTAGPKRSDYLISVTKEPETLMATLDAAFGIRGTVRKQRWLYWVGNTRIHLDQVEKLGSFLELEVVLESGESPEQGELIALDLMEKLGINESDLIEEAYIDLFD